MPRRAYAGAVQPSRFVSAGRLHPRLTWRSPWPRSTNASRRDHSGSLSSVYPALAAADPERFGLCVVRSPAGREDGDADGVHHHERREAVRVRAGRASRRRRRGTAAGRRQRHRAAVQLGRRRRARPGRPDQPDGQPGRDRHDQPGARRRPSRSGGSASSTGCPASPAARWHSTTSVSPRPRRRTTATARWPTCCTASARSTGDPAEARRDLHPAELPAR